MKKIFSIILSLTIIFTIFNLDVMASNKAPQVSADSAILIDANSGKILFSKNKDTAYPPASTTKIMTALLTLENCNLDDVVTVGKNPPFADGSKIYIFEGEKLKVKDLLYALLLASANDCADALAEHIGGSIDNFVQMMNKRAKELGCTHTNFVNPNGLYNKNHKTSAYDLALIMKEVIKRPEFKEISTTGAYKMPSTNKTKEKRPLWNHNRLIQKNDNCYYPDCEGGKTGYTIQSKHSYVASASRNGQRLIVALVHDPVKTFFSDSKNLFDYGFNNYESCKLYNKNDVVSTFITKNDKEISLLAEKDFYYTKTKNSSDKPTIDVKTYELKDKSFKKGEAIISANITFDGMSENLKLISSAATDDAPSIKSTSKTNNKISSIFNGKNIAIFFSALIALFLLRVNNVKRRRNNKKLGRHTNSKRYL